MVDVMVRCGRIAAHLLTYVTTGTLCLVLSNEHPSARRKLLRPSRRGLSHCLSTANNGRSAAALFHELVALPNRWAAQRCNAHHRIRGERTTRRWIVGLGQRAPIGTRARQGSAVSSHKNDRRGHDDSTYVADGDSVIHEG
jgi:hypothetical protein